MAEPYLGQLDDLVDKLGLARWVEASSVGTSSAERRCTLMAESAPP